jgi:hypothetical protein
LVKAFAFLAVTPSEPLMKIATFNVNNLNKRLVNLLDWLRASRPDVACLQELKATDSQFPITAIEWAGYCAVWRGQKSWNGVAILARDCQPVLTHTDLSGDPADTHSRYIEAAINGVLIATLYAPNGNPQPGPKFKYKPRLVWGRPRAGSGFYRLARRSVRQVAGRTGHWRNWCCITAAKIRQPRSRTRRWPIS